MRFREDISDMRCMIFSLESGTLFLPLKILELIIMKKCLREYLISGTDISTCSG